MGMDYERSTKKQKLTPTAATNPLSSSTSYQVFLSFSGQDTRKGFTDFLFNDLVDAGIHTFRDSEEVHLGEEIGPELLKAINGSKISIPIFSKGYASSKWCLRELTQMLHCLENTGQKIFPIFYDVEPSEVQHQTGCYEEAFNQHRERFDEKTMRGWREAMRKVGQLKGWELQKETNGHQGELVKMVVIKVLLELKKNHMVLTDNLVGIDPHIEEMMRLLNVDSIDVLIVGIHGMGGIGKTTIAKFIYNQLSERFDCCCFLADVREMSKQHKGLVNLQNQFISRILKRKCSDIVDVDEGISMIKGKVCNKKVLIVLDDVDEKFQFDMLIGKRDCFFSGSRIIVTTRNKEVVNQLNVDRTYEPSLMGPDFSLQLFSKHAFRRDVPSKDYDTLSRKIVTTAAGLPLALEVIGSFLFAKGKAIWEETLMKLKEIPNDQVQKKLRISYEALNDETKQIFLDIACMFIGMDKRNAFYMWEDCKFYPTNGINVLILRSLVKIRDDDTLWMHEQLRDLGREIVRKENFKDPGERSRLWFYEDALNVIERQMGTKKVEVLCLDSGLESHSQYLTNEEFWQLPSLRFLQLNNTDLIGDFERHLSALRWFDWRRCPGNFSPTNFHMKNLVILNLSNSNIGDDWETWTQLKMAKKLKVLDLSRCFGLRRTPDFSTFVALERLILKECTNLVEIDPSLGHLINLRVLDISFSGIKKLPEEAIRKLEKLEEIDVSSCFDLRAEIPSNIIGMQSSLRKLILDSTEIDSLPTSIRELSHLQTLNFFECRELELPPEIPSSLTTLLVTCKSRAFPSFCNLINLKELPLLDCWYLVKIPGDFGKLSKLETLPAEIGALSQLKQLQVKFCSNLQRLLGLPSSLVKLHLCDCKSVQILPDLSNLKKLSELKLYSCSELMEIQGLGKLELLTSLDVSSCGKLTELGGFEQLESLKYLNTSKCSSLERLPDLSNLKKLKKLVTNKCKKLMEIQGLDKVESLQHLEMSRCIFIERLPDLSNLGMLKQLSFWGCRKLTGVAGLGSLRSLERLNMSHCVSCEGLLDLSNLKKLRDLRIRGWKNFTLIWGLEELESLEELDIAECELVGKSPDLSNLKQLKSLKVRRCENLTEIQGLGKLKSLSLLDISGCKSLKKLPNLPNTEIVTAD